MPIKFNPYNWEITKPENTDLKELRKISIEELYDAINQPYVIEEDIDSLIHALYLYQKSIRK